MRKELKHKINNLRSLVFNKAFYKNISNTKIHLKLTNYFGSNQTTVFNDLYNKEK